MVKRKQKLIRYGIDMNSGNSIIVYRRCDNYPVAKFSHGNLGNQKSIAVMVAVAHSLTLEDRSIGI